MEYFDRHPNLDALEFYILGQLHHSEQQQMAEHLKGCDACQKMTGDLQEQFDLIREEMLVA